jgi:hypothetical protein
MMPNYSFILIAIFSLLLCCCSGSRAGSTTLDTIPSSFEESFDQTFLGNCNSLRKSEGFRQNVWLNFNQDSHAAICMDLDHQLYLVVKTELPLSPIARLSTRFRKLQITADTLRKRMEPEAYILDGEGIDLIIHIPSDAEETFAADLFNELLDLKLKPNDIIFQWD